MWIRSLLAAAVLTAAAAVCLAQRGEVAPSDSKGTYLGVLFAPLSDTQLAQLPQLPKGQGIRVTQVLANSPAAKAQLQRDDIVLEYNGEKIRDCEHFATLIIKDKPKNKVKLAILREGEAKTIEATLTLGPALRLMPHKPASDPKDLPKAVGKPGGPDSVSVTATPLGENTMRVTIEFYEKGKIQPCECQGTAEEIDKQLEERLPQREREAVRAFLTRIRKLTTEKPSDVKKPERKN